MELELTTTVSFSNINHIVMETLTRKGNDHIDKKLLTLIGSCYYKLILSDKNQLSLKIPAFRKENVKPVLEYLHFFDLLVKIIYKSAAVNYDGFALFDILAYESADKYKKRLNNFEIDYLGSDSKSIHFEHDVTVSKDRFLPLFPKEEINNYKEAISYSFELLKVIAKRNFIPYPVLINTSSCLTLFISESLLSTDERLMFRTIQTSVFKNSDDERDDLLDSLITEDLVNSIVFRYPYHVNIASTVESEFSKRTKQFKLELSIRFCYNEITDKDIIFLPGEFQKARRERIFNFLESFAVIKTSHNEELPNRLKEFKINWKAAQFNVFTTPFPIKWLLCIHGGEGFLFWRDLFIKNFPGVTGNLLKEALELIQLVINANWIDNNLQEDQNATVLIPKSHIFPEVYESLKRHISNKFKKVVYLDGDVTGITGWQCNLIFDPFNIILLSNLAYKLSPERTKIVVPDFLYFSHQPFIKYKIAKYQYEALIGGAREWADGEYSNNLQDWNDGKQNLLNKLREELVVYNKSFMIDNHQDVFDDEDEFIPEYLETEIIQIANERERGSNRKDRFQDILVITTEGNTISLRKNSRILLEENGYILQTTASVLKEGSSFIPLTEIQNSIDVKGVVDRMASISDKAKNWKTELFHLSVKVPHLFRTLIEEGLTVKESTFVKDYLNNQAEPEHFHLPRAKSDWQIVCEKLLITDMRPAWMAHKCREDLNKLKNAYFEVISYLIATSNFGINVSDAVLRKVVGILSQLSDIDDNGDEMEKNARSVINEVNKRIRLLQVRSVLEKEI